MLLFVTEAVQPDSVKRWSVVGYRETSVGQEAKIRHAYCSNTVVDCIQSIFCFVIENCL